MTIKDEQGTNNQTDDIVDDTPVGEDHDSTASPPERDWEAEARKMGWRGKDHYKGPPDKFIEAQEFVENGEKNLPIIRAALKHTQEEVDRLKRQGAEHARVIETARAQQVAALEADLAEARQARKEAVTAGDGDAFDAAEREVQRLEAEKGKAKAPPKTDPPADVQAGKEAFDAWIEQHPRFRDDQVFFAVCERIAASPPADLKDKVGKREEFWDGVYAAAEKQMEGGGYVKPSDKDRPGPQRGGRGNDTTGERGTAGARSYDRLTQDMRRTCDRMARDYGYEGKRLDAFRKDYASQCSDDAFTK